MVSGMILLKVFFEKVNFEKDQQATLPSKQRFKHACCYKGIVFLFQRFAYWVLLHDFYQLLIVFKMNLFKKSFRSTVRVSNSLDPADLNFLQRSSKDDDSLYSLPQPIVLSKISMQTVGIC